VTVQLDSRAAEEGLSPWRAADERTRQRRRWLLSGVLVVFVASVVVFGVPTGREWLTAWMLLTLLAACGGRLAVWRRAVVKDWLPLLGVLFAYDLLRGLANEFGGSVFGLARWRSNPDNIVSVARAHMDSPINADKWMFDGTVPTTWLQDRYFDLGVVHWYDRVAVTVYLSHFLLSLGLAILLWCISYHTFRRYLATLVTLTLITLVTYVLYPAAPPWMAGLNGHLPPVSRVVRETLAAMSSTTVNTAVEKGAAYSNPVAAMPSLHAAIPAMLMLFLLGHRPLVAASRAGGVHGGDGGHARLHRRALRRRRARRVALRRGQRRRGAARGRVAAAPTPAARRLDRDLFAQRVHRAVLPEGDLLDEPGPHEGARDDGRHHQEDRLHAVGEAGEDQVPDAVG
jgi:hypothetical protein